MFEKIVLAIDESDFAPKVLKAAEEFGSKFGSEFRVVHVLETGFAGRAGAVYLESSEEAHHMVNEAVAGLESKGFNASGTVRAGLHGRLAVEINDEASTFGATLIIVGTRGLTDIEGMLLGSTSHRLMHLSALPVLVIP